MYTSIKKSPLAIAVLLSCSSTALIAAAGDRLGAEFRVNTYTANNQFNPRIAMDADGDFVITWLSIDQDGSGEGVYAQRYQADGTKAGDEFFVNTTTENDQVEPNIAMDADGDFVITWQSNGQDSSGIYAQRYQANGTQAGGEFLVNTPENRSNRPSIAMDADGDFVITWNGRDDGSVDIYAQRYQANGTKAGAEFLVNTTTENPTHAPSIAMDADGDFVITWTSGGSQKNRSEGVYAQRYQANGTKAGDEFLVNTYTGDIRGTPSIAMDADGDFVITWSNNIQDGGMVDSMGNNFGVYAQRYQANGTKAGAEFRVNTTTANNQIIPSIAMDADGDFVITWASENQDGSSYGAYAQRYRANGLKAGAEFLVNTHTADVQGGGGIAMDADGDFVITWNSENQDGSGFGVYAQRYEGSNDEGSNDEGSNDEGSNDGGSSDGGSGALGGLSLLLLIPLWLRRRFIK